MSSNIADIEQLTDIFKAWRTDAHEPVITVFRREGADTMHLDELARETAAISRRLIADGLKPGERVVLCDNPSAAWCAVAAAVLRAGGVVVPIDAQMADETLLPILEDCRPLRIYTDDERGDRLREAGLPGSPDIALLNESVFEGRPAEKGGQPGEGPEIGPQDAAVLFYTSGTTGRPKGVPLTHGNLAYQIRALAATGAIRPDDRMLVALPLHHVYPFVMGLLLPLAMQMPIIFPAGLTGPQLTRAMSEGEASILLGVPRLYESLYSGIRSRFESRGRAVAAIFRLLSGFSTILRLRMGISAGRLLLKPLHKSLAPRLRLLASGGAVLDPGLARKLEGLGWDVTIGYGLTETAPLLTLRLPGKGPLESVGKPIAGTDLRVDPGVIPGSDGGTEAGEEKGEILAKGPGVFHGYRNLDEDTAEAFTGDGWFRTGDIGYLDENGYLYITGRTSTLIVLPGGKNIQPSEVEQAYSRDAAIAEIGVLEKDGQLAALVVPDREALSAADGEDPREAAEQAVSERSRSLPSYMRLSQVRVTRQSLPRTRLGKIRRHLLAEQYEQAAGGEQTAGPPLAREDMSDNDSALLDGEAARRVWEWLCARFPDRGLSPDSSPQMDLGIDSLEWLNLTLGLQEETGVEISEDALGRVATVRDLLSEASIAQGGSKTTADPVEEPYKALSSDQQRWLRTPGPAMQFLFYCGYGLVWCLVRLLYRLEIRGREHLPGRNACVLAPNHASFLDPFAVGCALGFPALRNTYWAGITTAAFNSAAKRLGCRLAKVVPVDPRQGAVGALAFASAILGEDRSLVWFPEGRRSPDGRLREFKPGLGKVLKKISTPVVPIWISGTHRAWPVGRSLPRPGRIRVTFGPPADPEELDAEGEGESFEQRVMDGLRRRVADLAED